MPGYSPTNVGLTPGKRVGAAKSASKLLVAANPQRAEVVLSVDHESAKVTLNYGPTAVLGEGPFITKANGLVRLVTKSDISIISDTEGANEKQTVTISGAKGGKFTLTYSGKTTGELKKAATKEEVQTALEGLTTIGAGNVGVTGEAGGPWTVEFKGALKAMDVDALTASAAKLEAEGEEVPKVTVATTVPGGVSVLFAEA